jgi:hypothetical protein
VRAAARGRFGAEDQCMALNYPEAVRLLRVGHLLGARHGDEMLCSGVTRCSARVTSNLRRSDNDSLQNSTHSHQAPTTDPVSVLRCKSPTQIPPSPRTTLDLSAALRRLRL